MTLNGPVISHNTSAFRAKCVKFTAARPMLSASEVHPRQPSFGHYMFIGVTCTVSAVAELVFICIRIIHFKCDFINDAYCVCYISAATLCDCVVYVRNFRQTVDIGIVVGVFCWGFTQFQSVQGILLLLEPSN